MIWIAASIILVIAIFNFFGFFFSAPAYKGNKSDHFNGKTFVNQNDIKAKGFKDLIKWAINRNPGKWAEIDDLETKPVIQDRLEPDELTITFINHSTFLIQIGPYNILTDPIWSKRASPLQFAGPKRMTPPGMYFNDLPPIDYVLISHNHYDHMDMNTLKRIQKKHSPQFFVPLGNSQFLNDLGISQSKDLDWGGYRIDQFGLGTDMCTRSTFFRQRYI